MKIETERLDIIALTPKQLELWIDNIVELEKQLACAYKAEPMEGLFREIACGQVEKAKKDPINYLWHTFWLIVNKSDNVVVGAIDFKDTPDSNGEVEIGYGLGREFQHHGYMTETVAAFCKWALRQDGVNHIIAETDLDGASSQKLLIKCGFKEYARNDTIWWRL
ncbi:GNAT family N-acetyltransferase [Anaerovorax odorimutans]|uniref:GNAT family N-acetyltransferase n=1 Tax=Anaerovorax odorimutans TaxID=109327 RepID=A0ABT1RMP6_9FIRM|nr:GNAT family N-acetyltransferase [Anaerovorax odorimutans]MCQ4636470.1 GNAT family N-acetyltransferase [Anaerovorax odorimutans]